MNREFDKAVHDVIAYLDAELETGIGVLNTPLSRINEVISPATVMAGVMAERERLQALRAALLEGYELQKVEERHELPSYATLEEAKAAIWADRHCPRDVSDEQLTEWARPFVKETK